MFDVSSISDTISVVEVVDTEDSCADDLEPNDKCSLFVRVKTHGEVRMVNEPQDRDENTTHQIQFTSDMTDSEILHVQNEYETNVCVTEQLINDYIQEESTVQNDWLQMRKVYKYVDNAHLEFKVIGYRKIPGMHVIFH